MFYLSIVWCREASKMIPDCGEVCRSHREVVSWRPEIFPRRLENVTNLPVEQGLGW